MALSLKPSAFSQVPQFPGATLVWANYCGHCHRFMPEFNEWAQQMGTRSGKEASSTRPLVTRIDAAKYGNEIQSNPLMQNVQGFPTTLFFDGHGNSEKYTGPRTVEGLKAGWSDFQKKSSVM